MIETLLKANTNTNTNRNTNPLGLFIADNTGAVMSVDEGVSDQPNTHQENLLAFNWTNNLHPDDQARVSSNWLSYVESNAVKSEYTDTFRVLDPQQHSRYYKVFARPLLNTKGQVERYMGYTFDITAETQRTEELSKTHALIESLKGMRQVSRYEMDHAGALVTIDDALLAIVGHAPKDVTGDGWLKTIHPEDVEAFTKKWISYIDSGSTQPLQIACRVIAKDQSIRYVKSVTVPVVKDAVITGYYGVLFNVTEEYRLVEKNALYQKILNECHNMIGIFSLSTTKVIYLNFSFKRFVGITNDKPEYDIAPYHSPSTLKQITEEVIPTAINKGTWAGKLDFIDKEGQSVPCRSVLTCHYDQVNKPIFVSGVFQDLCPELMSKQKENSRQEQMARMMQLALMGETATGIAHQLNQPLAVISSTLQLWQSQVTQNNKQAYQMIEQDIDAVIQQVTDIGKLIHHINNLFKRDLVGLKALNMGLLKSSA